ncbi:MAG: MraY family glycosyltransferase [Sphingomonadaceae bacterium]
MSQNPVWFALAGLYAVIVTVAISHFSRPIGRRWALMDHPSQIKQHLRSTPLAGGVALVAVLAPLLPIFMYVFEPSGLGNRALSVIVIAALAAGFLGLADDRRNIRPVVRFVATMAIFACAMLLEPRLIIDRVIVTGLGSSFTMPTLAAFSLSLLIHVGFINAVNMADGKNGLVIGLSIIWLLFLLTVGPAGLIIVVLPLVQMLGILLIYNLRGRLFLGDGGTYGLSAFIGLVSVYCYNYADGAVKADTLALLYLVPGIDMLRLVVIRMLQGRSPFYGDRNHLHHLLKDRFGWPIGLFIYLIMVAAPIFLALARPDWTLTLFGFGAASYFVTVLALVFWRRSAVAQGAIFGSSAAS